MTAITVENDCRHNAPEATHAAWSAPGVTEVDDQIIIDYN